MPDRVQRKKKPGETRAPAAPQRLKFALELLGDGKRYCAVRDAIMARFAVSRGTAENDIARAYEEIGEELQKEKPGMAGRLVAFLWREAYSASRRGHSIAAVSAAREIRELIGLGGPAGNGSSGGGVDADTQAFLDALRMTPAERAQAARDLDDEEKAGDEPGGADEE